MGTNSISSADTKNRRARTAKRKSRRTSVGVNGPLALDLLYRLGTLTGPHFSALADISRTQAQATLQALRENGICEQRDRKPHWFPRKGRAPAHFYLGKGNYGTGILEGATEAGLGTSGKHTQKRAMNRYARFALPQQAQHRWLCNEFFTLLVQGSRLPGGKAYVPVDSLWGESAKSFPLTKGSASEIYPDGQFWVGVPWQDGHFIRPLYLEGEAWPRREEAVRKIERYLQWWRSITGASGRELVQAGFGPVVFVYPHQAKALMVRDYVRQRFDQELDKKGNTQLSALVESWRQLGIEQHPGTLFLFVGLDRLEANESAALYGRSYLPLYGHPEVTKQEAEGAVSIGAACVEVYKVERSNR